MKLSIIVPIYNSHEIVRRQLLNFSNMGIPDDVEILYMDDSSDPPLSSGPCNFNLRIIPVNNPALRNPDGMFYDGRNALARNLGAKSADGEFLLMTDIDYIIRKEDIEAGRNLEYDKQSFRRQFGVIMEDGTVTQDIGILRKYGLTEKRIKERGVDLPPHPNNFIMRKSTFLDLGGYRKETFQKEYPSRCDTYLKRDWVDYQNSGKGTLSPNRTTLLMFPNGQFCGDLDYNPFGLFHNLSRKTKRNPLTKEVSYGNR